MRKKILATTLLLCLAVTACGGVEVDNTKYSQSIIIKDTSALNSDIQSFLTGTTADNLSTFNDDVELQDGPFDNTSSSNAYLSRDAYYYEINDTIFRFQLDINGNITSYIKYNKIGGN